MFGRAYCDKLAYIGGLDHRERRKGLGFTINKSGKVIIIERDGDRTIGDGIVADLTAYTYRSIQGSTNDPHGDHVSSPTAASASEIRVDSRTSSSLMPQLPSFWDEDGILHLLQQILTDPAANWNAMILLTKALRGEQVRLWREDVSESTVALFDFMPSALLSDGCCRSFIYL